ncbi:MAG: 3-oxoacid CoA-transferase subunit A [Peptococcaceae bacterium]|nr:3-oxoacid CoA-transferase subunit A [Peptococcaceae bacterium]
MKGWFRLKKVVSREEALSHLKEGQTIMIGGFLAVGTPETLVDGIIEKRIGNLTVINNDTAFVDKGTGKLVVNKLIKKFIGSHIGTNPETGKQMNAGEIEVELIPQGTLAERIRSAGVGFGGFLTPTGLGTVVEKGKQKIEIDGKTYLLELPLRAEVALLKAAKADEFGNLIYRRLARNFNPMMAMAADLVIVEADEIVPTGSLDPDEIVTPGIFVDMIVKG